MSFHSYTVKQSVIFVPISQVKQQHIKTAKDLVQNGLHANLDEEFDVEKIFFVSAREVRWGKYVIL